MSYEYGDHPRYQRVADRQASAAKRIAKLRLEGYEIAPIPAFNGSKIAQSFWGQAWCRHLESFSDYENRLPRGRSYARNGSVCHLSISAGRIEAFVSGSELYEIDGLVTPLPDAKWRALKTRCAGKIGTLLELLQGKLSDEVMKIVCDPNEGLFPTPREMRLNCSCPDHADLCKHLAAALYGVAARLDAEPELLFLLRGVDHNELIATHLDRTLVDTPGNSSRRRLAATALSDVFGIDIAASTSEPKSGPGTSFAAIPAAPAPSSPSPAARSKPKPRLKPKAPKPGPATGQDIFKLRRRFGMTEWEFGTIAEVSSTAVRNWEAKGAAPHGARAGSQAILNTIAQLSKSAAWDRLNEYL